MLLPVAQPLENFVTVRCDSFSIAYVGIAVAVAGFWFLVPAQETNITERWSRRLAVGGALALVISAALAVVFSACRAGPFSAVPADQWPMWLEHASELEPLTKKSSSLVAIFLTPPLMGCATSVFALLSSRRRSDVWWGLLVLQIIGVIATVASLRAYMMADILAVVPIVWLLVRTVKTCHARLGRWWRATGALGAASAIVLAPLILGRTLAALSEDEDDQITGCDARELRTALRAVNDAPPGLVAADIFDGPYILTASHHAVLGAPYLQNVAGNRKVHAILGAADANVAARAARRLGVDYLLVCEHGHFASDSFYMKLAAGDVPVWLAPVSRGAEGLARLYAVKHKRLDVMGRAL